MTATTTTTTTQLALPPAGGSGGSVEARRGILPLGVAVTGAGVIAILGGLVAAYLALRSETAVWPPKGTTFDNYTASTLTITVLMAMVTAEWAAYGIRKNFRGQALFGFGITVMLGAAYLNGLAYLINGFDFAVGESPYATVVYALCGVAFVIGVVGIVAIVVTALRAVGHQLTTDNYALLRGAAFLWHLAAIAWFVVYYTVYISK